MIKDNTSDLKRTEPKARITRIGTVMDSGELTGFAFDGSRSYAGGFEMDENGYCAVICGWTYDELRALAESNA